MIRLMSEKSVKTKKFSIPLNMMGYLTLVYLVLLFFVPNIGETGYSFVIPIFSVITIIYTILLSILIPLIILGIIMISLFTYTDKLNGQKFTISKDDLGIKISSIFSWAKSFGIIYFGWNTGYSYLVVLTVIASIGNLFFYYIKNDYIAKITKTTLLAK